MSSSRQGHSSRGQTSRHASSRSTQHDASDDDDSPPTESIHNQSRSTSAAYSQQTRGRSESSASTVNESTGQTRYTAAQKGKGKAVDHDRDERESDNQQEREAAEYKETEMRRRFGLPAVKGTIGAIESPRRAVFPSSPSVSTIRASSPQPTWQQHEGDQDVQARPAAPPVFRIDQTLKSCFDTVNLPQRAELQRLFLS